MNEIDFRNLSGLTITDIKLKFNSRNVDTGPVKAFVTIVLNNALTIKGLKIVEGKFGYYVSWPSIYNERERKGDNVAFPVNKNFGDYVSDTVLKEFKNPSFHNVFNKDK